MQDTQDLSAPPSPLGPPPVYTGRQVDKATAKCLYFFTLTSCALASIGLFTLSAFTEHNKAEYFGLGIFPLTIGGVVGYYCRGAIQKQNSFPHPNLNDASLEAPPPYINTASSIV